VTLSRRHFAVLCAGLGTGAGVLPFAGLATASGAPAFLSAYRDVSGAFGVAGLDETGALLFTEALPARGHDTIVSPDRSMAITFARRPGRFALVIDLHRQAPAFAFEAAPGRHFYGHGFFSTDGRMLYATENDYEGERGVLGIYDVDAGFARIGELDTYGIGPHEALLLADQRTIAVANGGILTHPDVPRQKLNLASMQASLVYLDSQTGDLLEQVVLPPDLHQLSIRHMDQAGDGSLWFGAQYEGAPTDEVALIGRHACGRMIEFVDLPGDQLRSLRQYVGSVKASAEGTRVAITSPRGGVALVLDTTHRSIVDQMALPDVCGVAAGANGFALTTGGGLVSLVSEQSHPMRWDNHLRSVMAHPD
jgi:hypothetical protein